MLIWEEGLTISDTFCFVCFGNWEGGETRKCEMRPVKGHERMMGEYGKGSLWRWQYGSHHFLHFTPFFVPFSFEGLVKGSI